MIDQAQPTSQPKSSTTSAFDSSESMEGGTYLSPPAFSLTASSANSPGEPESAGPDANTVTLVSGQMTRLGEDKPKYVYWPATASSGVTLGIGYDIGGRSKASVITQLTAAGMSMDQATKIAEGAGLKGDAANQFVIDNKKSIGTIADAVAEALFTDTMAAKRKEAKALATSKTASQDGKGNYVNARGREMQDQVEEGSYVMSGEQWDRLHPAMVELITDMKFQGGFYAYDRIAKVNAVLIAHDGDDLAQFKGVAALFESDEEGEISYMDKYHDSLTPNEDSMNNETFFGQSKAEISRSWRRRNRVRYAFLLQVIKALESGKAVAMSGQANLPRPVATPVVKSPAYAEGDRILATAETKGASLETAKAEDPNIKDSGASASEKLVRGDLDSIVPLADLFKEIGNEKGLPPALLAAIASRETSIGKKLNANDCTPDGKRTGVMGINDQVHPSPGNEDQGSNIVRAASILVNLRAEIQAKFPAWSPADQLLGAVTAYHQSAGFVAKWDGKAIEGDDFASDTWARARYLAALKMFSGLDPIPVMDSKDKGKETTDPTIRPEVKKGRLIAQSVGRGGINHPDDVQAVLQRLLELDVISQQEAGIQTESAVGEYVERYQNLIFNKGADGLMEPGKLTETKLINGERNKPTPTKKQPSEPKGGPKGDKNPPKRKEKNPKAGSKPEVPDYKSIAERVNHDMVGGFFWGAGTDETGISIALSELHRDPTHIKEFKAVYQTMYGRDLVEHIDSEVDNYFLLYYHGQLDEIMSWLTPKAEMKVDGLPEKKAEFDFTEIELDVKEYWKSQGKSANCDLFAKMVIDGHRADHPELYEGLGDLSGARTTEENSLHVVWEKDHELGTARAEGPKNANDSDTLVKDEGEWDIAIRYIIACLKIGVPVMVGVNHTFAYGRAAANPDKTTDHWLTIIGKGEDEVGKYFVYTDPGAGAKVNGTNSATNRLYQTDDPHIWRDETKNANVDAGKGSYSLVAVSLYDNHRGKSEFKVGNESFKRNKI